MKPVLVVVGVALIVIAAVSRRTGRAGLRVLVRAARAS